MAELSSKHFFTKAFFIFLMLLGGYLFVAWASYTPLDNSWSVASSLSQTTLNRGGYIGAFSIDLLLVLFGKIMVLIPFVLVTVPAYLWGFRLFHLVTLRSCVFWAVSALVLLCGMSILSAVLLSNDTYYLAGGIIGDFCKVWITAYLGQIGGLLIGMIITAIGFYLCSGQILIQLFGYLYEWVMEEKTPTVKTHIQESSFANNIVEISPINEESEEKQEHEENESASQLTDVSIFTRPKISGLRQTEQEIQNSAIADISELSVNDLSLPKVSIEETSLLYRERDENLEEQVDIYSHKEERPLPTVRLNLESDTNSAKVSLAESSQPSFMFPEAEEVEIPKETTKAQMKKEENVVYPKGYGDSLIHPLLQRKKNIEKPTTPLPTLDLLNPVQPSAQQITEQEIRETSVRIEKELANFGVKATVEDVLVGPVVTRYEILPAAGVKASKITSLDNDLARALIFKAIRITDVVPGKPYMGIETPNRHRETVWLREVLDSNEFKHSKAILPMALGKAINGTPVVVDMAKMPHLLVAGQTGGGKSVGVNTMILSLLFKLTPEQVRFIMIDPKVVELSVYNDIPHLLTPVVTDMKKAENALRWAVEEMERRYLLVSQLGVRNIEGYNDKIQQAAEMNLPIPNPLWRPGDTMDSLPPPLAKMSYIVLVVDEFADLMMSAGKQVEDHIMRIAQKARAVGIHLILATQRPSTDVITGVIKANIPSRIAFTVASQIDSRTILDKGGAESLLGRGDMLYSGAGSPEIIRIHGAFMTDDEVQKVADNWRARGKPDYIDSIVESREEGGEEMGRSSHELDPLFDEITQFMIDGGATSISGIQRRFSIGFNRAARIIDQLEEQGILSAPDNRGKREVLAR